MVSTPFDKKELCKANKDKSNPLISEFYEHPFPKRFIRKLEFLIRNISEDPETICEKDVQFKAEVIFRIATNDVSVTVVTRRLSFFDKVSAFGKNLFDND